MLSKYCSHIGRISYTGQHFTLVIPLFFNNLYTGSLSEVFAFLTNPVMAYPIAYLQLCNQRLVTGLETLGQEGRFYRLIKCSFLWPDNMSTTKTHCLKMNHTMWLFVLSLNRGLWKLWGKNNYLTSNFTMTKYIQVRDLYKLHKLSILWL